MILDKLKLDGKFALVTGAASGLGQAIAIALAEAGADVACHCRNSGQAVETVSAITRLGRKGIEITGDLAEDARFGCDSRRYDLRAWPARYFNK